MRFPCTGRIGTCAVCREVGQRTPVSPRALFNLSGKQPLPQGNFHLISYSVSTTEGVFRTCDHPKFLNSEKWLFLTVPTASHLVRRGFEFCQKQLCKPINARGVQLWNMWCCLGSFRPHGAMLQQTIDSLFDQQEWFCSEFVAAYLLVVGYNKAIPHDPCRYTPAQLYVDVLNHVPDAMESDINPYVNRLAYRLEIYSPELSLTPSWNSFMSAEARSEYKVDSSTLLIV